MVYRKNKTRAKVSFNFLFHKAHSSCFPATADHGHKLAYPPEVCLWLLFNISKGDWGWGSTFCLSIYYIDVQMSLAIQLISSE